MKITLNTAAAVIALSMLAGSGTALGKAHDQGVADGSATPQPTTGAFVQSLGGNGVSAIQNKGKRGDDSSEDKGTNRVNPVVGNGANSD